MKRAATLVVALPVAGCFDVVPKVSAPRVSTRAGLPVGDGDYTFEILTLLVPMTLRASAAG